MIKKVTEYILNEYTGIVDDDFVQYLFDNHDVADCTIMQIMQLVHDEYEIYARGL